MADRRAPHDPVATGSVAPAETAANAVLLFASGGAAQALAAAFDRAGWRLSVATTEEEALQALEDGEFDLVLVHLNAPDPERLDVVKLLRMSDPGGRRPPVMVLADVMSEAVEQACTDAGVDLRLLSPIEPRHLLDYARDLLAGSRSG